ncbi:hypothetical protein M9Y10_036527 [Tritrichomonas musculus]|uniref:Uncharacterized protein n=1 Tax=Tritrichomonas musculus TaxID=1915356 RepID=A0ABR2GUA9_9EUKA
MQIKVQTIREDNQVATLLNIRILWTNVFDESLENTIQVVTDEVKEVNQGRVISYIYSIEVNDSSKILVKRIKPINDHYNLPQFGASVFTWSKRII